MGRTVESKQQNRKGDRALSLIVWRGGMAAGGDGGEYDTGLFMRLTGNLPITFYSTNPHAPNPPPQAARPAALLLAIARKQEAAQQVAGVVHALLQREQQHQEQRQQAARMLSLVGRLGRCAAARVPGVAR